LFPSVILQVISYLIHGELFHLLLFVTDDSQLGCTGSFPFYHLFISTLTVDANTDDAPYLLPPFLCVCYAQVHLPSLTAFANWPTSSTPLGHVTAVDFASRSEYVAIGNTRGRVLLYHLKDYGAGGGGVRVGY